MPFDQHTRDDIQHKIDEIERDYQSVPGLILTEDDLKCLVYRKLSELPGLVSPEPSIDPAIKAISLHSEVSWYDQNGNLAIKPDITILQPANLSILHGINRKIRLPSKQFEFRGNAILMESKFIRQKAGITGSTLRAIEKDIKKIRSIYDRLGEEGERTRASIFCFFVIFNKTNRGARKVHEFIQSNSRTPWYTILYKSGNVTFPSGRRNVA